MASQHQPRVPEQGRERLPGTGRVGRGREGGRGGSSGRRFGEGLGWSSGMDGEGTRGRAERKLGEERGGSSGSPLTDLW